MAGSAQASGVERSVRATLADAGIGVERGIHLPSEFPLIEIEMI